MLLTTQPVIHHQKLQQPVPQPKASISFVKAKLRVVEPKRPGSIKPTTKQKQSDPVVILQAPDWQKDVKKYTETLKKSLTLLCCACCGKELTPKSMTTYSYDQVDERMVNSLNRTEKELTLTTTTNFNRYASLFLIRFSNAHLPDTMRLFNFLSWLFWLIASVVLSVMPVFLVSQRMEMLESANFNVTIASFDLLVTIMSVLLLFLEKVPIDFRWFYSFDEDLISVNLFPLQFTPLNTITTLTLSHFKLLVVVVVRTAFLFLWPPSLMDKNSNSSVLKVFLVSRSFEHLSFECDRWKCPSYGWKWFPPYHIL